MEPQNQIKSTPKGVSLIIIAFIGLLVIAYLMSVSFKNDEVRDEKQYTKENVEVSKVDLATAQGDGKIPSGFPKDIPVEVNGIFESLSSNYKDRGVILYKLSYSSGLSLDEAYDLYAQYLSKAKYTLDGGTKTENTRSLYGRRGDDSFSVVIAKAGEGLTTVQISYTDRQ